MSGMGKGVGVFFLPSKPRNVIYLGVDIFKFFGQRPSSRPFLKSPLSKSSPCDNYQFIAFQLQIHPSGPALQ